MYLFFNKNNYKNNYVNKKKTIYHFFEIDVI